MHNPEDRSFIGHPRGLAYIAFAEAWERFSYYGMQSLLVLYMVNRLLHPGHIEHIAGFGPFRHLIEVFRGPLAVQPLASTVFGLYTGLVYLTPIVGGLIADRVLGRTRTITIGALLMAVGHFLMAFDATFLLALTCLLTDVGCFKGNLASQVGGLYATGDNRRADAFQIYYIFINAGVIISPLIAGTLGEVYGWHWGFGAAGVGMLIGLTIYLSGRKWLPPDSPIVRKGDRAAKTALTRREKMAILALVVLLPVLTIAVIGNQQIFNAYLVWAERNADLIFFGKKMPTTWLITLDSILSVSCLFAAVVFWRLWAKKISGAGGNHQAWPRQHNRRDRVYLPRNRRSDRCEFGRKQGFNRLADYLSRSKQHRICKRLPRLARALRARCASCIVRHYHRHLLSGLLCGEQSRWLDRRLSRKNAGDTILVNALGLMRNSRRHLPRRGPLLWSSPRAGR